MLVHRTQFAFSLFVIVAQCSEIWASESTHRKHYGRSSRRSAEECRAVADLFGGINLGEGHVISVDKIDGTNLEICPKSADNKTCCTKQMEEKLLDLAVDKTQNVISTFSSDLKRRLAADARLYREHFTDLLLSSENSTKHMLTSNFKIPVQSANSSVEKLFSELAAYVRSDDQVNVRQSINHFFDILFPAVVTYVTDDNNTAAAMTEKYKECLMTNRKDFIPAPFGEVSKQLIQDTAKTLELARVLLDAFDLAAEVINVTTNMAYENYCSTALARLLFCSKCAGHSEARPCRDFCLNIAHGCMAHVTEIDMYWNLFLAAIERVVTSMQGSYDIQDTLISFHSKIYESFMHYIENAHRYPLQIVSKCGHPGNGTDSAEVMTTERNQQLLTLPAELQTQFSFDVAVRNIASSKGFFNRLSDAICNSEEYSAPDNICWNGTSISRYTRPVPAQALTTQVDENPEFKIPGAIVPTVSRIIERINQATRVLHNRAIARLPVMQADGTTEHSGLDLYGELYSGSGWTIGLPEDDDESGSATGSGILVTSLSPDERILEETSTDTTDFDFVSKSTSTTTQPPPPPYSTSPKSTTTTTTTTARGRVPPVGRGSMISPTACLLLLVVVVQRLLRV